MKTWNLAALIIGVLMLFVSIVWALTQDGSYEPWTALLGALLTVGSLIVSARQRGEERRNQQRNIVSIDNSMEIKNSRSQNRQSNLFSWGNQMKVTEASNETEEPHDPQIPS